VPDQPRPVILYPAGISNRSKIPVTKKFTAMAKDLRPPLDGAGSANTTATSTTEPLKLVDAGLISRKDERT
jgi:hypothetical protein